jgi:hypothetical protein
MSGGRNFGRQTMKDIGHPWLSAIAFIQWHRGSVCRAGITSPLALGLASFLAKLFLAKLQDARASSAICWIAKQIGHRKILRARCVQWSKCLKLKNIRYSGVLTYSANVYVEWLKPDCQQDD